MKNLIMVWACCSFCFFGYALGPHELVVLANRNSPDSMTIAHEYSKMRHIPDINIIELDLKLGNDSLVISRDAFTTQIWEPVNRELIRRGIEDHVLAWAYSSGFPIRTDTVPSLSIQGLTFLKNNIPESDNVDKGTYRSPLFAGPHVPGGRYHASQTFDVYKSWLGVKKMPLPNMMLAYTGVRGCSKETALDCLAKGVSSDGTNPKGKIYFIKSEDVRSKCRAWEFASAQEELSRLGVASVITEDFPVGKIDVLGLMMGVALAKPYDIKCFLPGCMAEQLTSFGAAFQVAGQTKLTEWINAGATASSGTVVEPMSLWSKFPSGRFFVHQVAGCTIIESFYQSIRCPLQILLVGEPLASPWLPDASIKLVVPESRDLSGVVHLSSVVRSEPYDSYLKYMYLLDGRVVKFGGENLEFNTKKFKNGAHVLRVVAYRVGAVQCQIFDEVAINIKN